MITTFSARGDLFVDLANPEQVKAAKTFLAEHKLEGIDARLFAEAAIETNRTLPETLELLGILFVAEENMKTEQKKSQLDLRIEALERIDNDIAAE